MNRLCKLLETLRKSLIANTYLDSVDYVVFGHFVVTGIDDALGLGPPELGSPDSSPKHPFAATSSIAKAVSYYFPRSNTTSHTRKGERIR